jgi:NAD(P)H-dependent flavin oxidoreductase YrpB (nitropropane dioxygenase family)
LGADAVAIGTLFAVARESELSSADKIAFAEAAAAAPPSPSPSTKGSPKVAAPVTRTNPDGSVVKRGDASAFGKSYGYAGINNAAILATAVNLPAAEILDLFVEDFLFHKAVEDAAAAL